ncbi:hypothetical protein PEDI_23220 [Persicobacter diffluens]|uniref:Uncharacterized protein n=1 Tax=Persicobacter diffluens TaxID=981 RepID=A0AAN4VZP0_9BACT|nr:hypothetical protein PEDI_23220 [Persicobacter diffluens]
MYCQILFGKMHYRQNFGKILKVKTKNQIAGIKISFRAFGEKNVYLE